MHHLMSGLRGIAPWVLGALIGVLPMVVHALGLGKIKIHSALNEPLNAEIEFTSISERELKGLSASLASRTDFDAAGVERLPFLSQLKFNVSKRADGRYVLRIATEQPIEEPFLHILLQLEWPGGRLIREYTALIDPPYQVAGRPTGIQVPSTLVVTPPVTSVAEPAVEPLPAEPPAAVARAEQPPPQELAREEKMVEPLPPLPEPVTAEPEPSLLGPPDSAPRVVISSNTGWPEDAAAPKVEVLEPAAPARAEGEPATAAPPVARATIPAVPAGAGTLEYKVERGDTMWRIAERVRTDPKLSIEQVILAIYRTNRDAFFGNNVNNLKAGKILRLPEREEIESITTTAARNEFLAQYDVWQEYKLKLASAGQAITVAEARKPSAVKPAEPSTKPEAPKAAAKAEEKAAGEKAPTTAREKKQPEELLKIVRANLQGEKGAPDKKVAETESTKDQTERQALADRVTTLEESLESKQMETKDLAEKVGQVRDQLKREARLIQLENKALAQTQPPATETAPAPKPAAKPAESPKPASSDVADKAKEQSPAATKAEKPVPRKRIAPPPPPPEEKGFVASLMDTVLDGDLMPVLLGGAVLVSGGIALVYLRRRRRSLAEFEESILSSEGAPSASTTTSETADTSGQVMSTGDTSFLSDFSQGGMGHVQTDEVDPIAEAEVYLAYGRDETAEEILKEAIVKNPARHELRVKLAEIYHQRNDVRAFETVAEELYAALGGRADKHWEHVESLGRKLNPDNPMFRGGAVPKPAAGPTVVTAPAAAAAFADTETAVKSRPAATAPTQLVESESGIDFDLGGPDEAETKAGASEPALDLDLGTPAAQQGAPGIDFDFETELKGEAAGSGATTEADIDALAKGSAPEGGIDFEPSTAATPEAATAGGIEWDLGAGGGEEDTPVAAGAPTAREESTAPPEQWDETATKLDLAKAYIDMGDAEGARSILDEVMAEGTDAQKKQAEELAAQIA